MSRNTIMTGLLVLTALLPVGAAASEYSALLQEAAGAMDSDFRNEWAFTETAVESETSTVARFNPTRAVGERWHLVSVDGREPTDEEIADFAKEKADEATRRDAEEEDGSDNDVADMVNADSLELLEENPDSWLFGFVPEDDGDDGFMKYVDGTLKIAKAGPYIEYIDMQSSQPFKPQTGVKINEFLTRLSFARAASRGPVVPVAVDVSIKARAFIVKKVEETMSIKFTDYEYVGGR